MDWRRLAGGRRLAAVESLKTQHSGGRVPRLPVLSPRTQYSRLWPRPSGGRPFRYLRCNASLAHGIAAIGDRRRLIAAGLVSVRPPVCHATEESLLKSSLSVVLPVCNAQANLPRRMSSLLEVLPELAGRFEMAVIDHGSSDATAELAHDMAAGYPQICVMSYPRPLDSSALLRCGLQTTSGDLVLFVLDAAADPHDFHRLALAAGTADAVAGRLQPTSAEGPTRPIRDAFQVPALLLFHRRVATAWRRHANQRSAYQLLAAEAYRIVEVVVRRLVDMGPAVKQTTIMSPPAMHALRSSKRSAGATASFRYPLGPLYGR